MKKAGYAVGPKNLGEHLVGTTISESLKAPTSRVQSSDLRQSFVPRVIAWAARQAELQPGVERRRLVAQHKKKNGK